MRAPLARAVIVGALTVSACSHDSGVRIGEATAGAGASASLHIHTGPGVGVLIGLGFVAALAGDEHRAERSPPPLDPSRRVVEQNCLKPLADSGANLRCR